MKQYIIRAFCKTKSYVSNKLNFIQVKNSNSAHWNNSLLDIRTRCMQINIDKYTTGGWNQF
jgi:hypothetical protein